MGGSARQPPFRFGGANRVFSSGGRPFPYIATWQTIPTIGRCLFSPPTSPSIRRRFGNRTPRLRRPRRPPCAATDVCSGSIQAPRSPCVYISIGAFAPPPNARRRDTPGMPASSHARCAACPLLGARPVGVGCAAAPFARYARAEISRSSPRGRPGPLFSTPIGANTFLAASPPGPPHGYIRADLRRRLARRYSSPSYIGCLRGFPFSRARIAVPAIGGCPNAPKGALRVVFWDAVKKRCATSKSQRAVACPASAFAASDVSGEYSFRGLSAALAISSCSGHILARGSPRLACPTKQWI